jgi:hypothetical protein
MRRIAFGVPHIRHLFPWHVFFSRVIEYTRRGGDSILETVYVGDFVAMVRRIDEAAAP